MGSLRRRLLVILLSLFTLAWLLLALMSYFNARHEVEELFDAQLSQSAAVLYGLTLHELEEEDPEEFDPETVGQHQGHRYQEKLAFQIWRRDELLLRSMNAPTVRMSTRAGYEDRQIDGQAWRTFSFVDEQRAIRIDVGELYDIRDELIYGMLVQVLLPMVLALPLLALLIRSGVGRALQPLDKTAREIGRRSAQQLHDVDEQHAPEEVKPVLRSLNTLLGRLRDAFDSERRFTANAAHELRTPLAGLKAQAQLALRSAGDEQRQALTQILRGVDRATRLVEQLLTLARLDPDHAVRDYERVDLARLAASVIADAGTAARERNIGIELSTEPVEVRGHAPGLSILLRNLIDNALRYTPEGGKVTIETGYEDGAVRLRVSDSGPGIPEAERARVFDRFYRIRGTTGDGCGLGLSIVHRIAELHHARVELRDNGPGLTVKVFFPQQPEG